MQDRLARALKLAKYDISDPTVAEIADVLFSLGGSSHRTAVYEAIARRRGAPFASPDLQAELLQAFERGAGQPSQKGMKPVLVLPFGPDSRRWSLDSEAFGHMHRAVTPAPAATERRTPNAHPPDRRPDLERRGGLTVHSPGRTRLRADPVQGGSVKEPSSLGFPPFVMIGSTGYDVAPSFSRKPQELWLWMTSGFSLSLIRFL